MKYLFTLLFFTAVATAQQRFTLQDSLTKMPVPYASVNLLNNYGLYADAQGSFTISDTLVKEVEISSIGYAAKRVGVKKGTGVIYLVPQPVAIEEVVILPKDLLKRKEAVTKPKGHQDINRLYMSSTALQYAFLVKSDTPDGYLSALALPLMEAAFESEGQPGVFTAVTFSTLVKIEVLQNINGQPGEKLGDFEQLAVVTNNGNLKKFDIALKEEIALPAEGVFVQLTIMGRADEKGNLLPGAGYTVYNDENGITRLFMRHCQPNFPLVERPKGPLTFIKQPFNDNIWKAINEPHLHAAKKYPDFNIPFGYTVATYK